VDRSKLERIGAAGRDLLLRENWTWRGNAARVVEAYREVAE